MNNIEILEDYLDKQDRKFVSEYRLMILEAIENLIQRNKDLEQILELMSKSLDNISYDQLPIAIEELKFWKKLKNKGVNNE